MKRAIGILLISACGAWASADIQIFFTSAAGGLGLADPAYAFLPTNGNQTDITDGNWVVDEFPTAMSNATVGVGDTVYVWFKFVNEANNRTVHELDLDASDGNPQAAWYILDDTNGDFADTRWTGAYTPPHAPEYQMAHKVLEHPLGLGLRNWSTDKPYWLYRGGAFRTYLLGAVRYDTPGTYTIATGGGGPSMLEIVPPWPVPIVELGSVTVTPEPASGALVALLALSMRRRQAAALRSACA